METHFGGVTGDVTPKEGIFRKMSFVKKVLLISKKYTLKVYNVIFATSSIGRTVSRIFVDLRPILKFQRSD